MIHILLGTITLVLISSMFWYDSTGQYKTLIYEKPKRRTPDELITELHELYEAWVYEEDTCEVDLLEDDISHGLSELTSTLEGRLRLLEELF